MYLLHIFALCLGSRGHACPDALSVVPARWSTDRGAHAPRRHHARSLMRSIELGGFGAFVVLRLVAPQTLLYLRKLRGSSSSALCPSSATSVLDTLLPIPCHRYAHTHTPATRVPTRPPLTPRPTTPPHPTLQNLSMSPRISSVSRQHLGWRCTGDTDLPEEMRGRCAADAAAVDGRPIGTSTSARPPAICARSARDLVAISA